MASNPNSPGGRKPPTSSTSTRNKRHAATIEGDAKDVTPQSTATSSGGAEKPLSSPTADSNSRAQSSDESNKTTSSAVKSEKEGKSQPTGSYSDKTVVSGDPKNGGQDKSLAGIKETGRQNEKLTGSVSSHVFSHIAAGGIGGILLLGLAWALGLISVPTESDRTLLSKVDQRLASLEAAVDSARQSNTVQTALSNKLAEVEKGLADKEAELQAVSQSISKLQTESEKILADNSEGAAVIEKFEPRINRLETTIKSLASAAEAESGSDISKAAGFAVQLNELEARLSKDLADFKTAYYLNQSRQQNISSGDLTKIRQDLKNISDRFASELQSLQVESQDATRNIDRLEEASSKIVQDLDKVHADTGEMSRSISAIDKKIEAYISKVIGREDVSRALTPVSTKLADLEKTVTAMLKREKLGQTDIERAALAIALSNLQRAIEQGREFASELDAVKNLAPEKLNLNTLSSFRNQGIPTTEALSSQFPSVAAVVLKADRTPEGNSVLNQFFSNARSVVRIRRTGEVQGESTEAVVARMEVRVKKGDLSGALAEAEGLTGPALEAAMPWLKQVRGRLAVNQAMEKIEKELISSISKTAQQNRETDRSEADKSSDGSGQQ